MSACLRELEQESTIIRSLSDIFESWIDPFRKKRDLQPPDDIWGFFWHYIGQAKLPFFAFLIVIGLTALVEAGMFYFMGRLVDMLEISGRAEGWQGFIAEHGRALAWMAAAVLVGRFVVFSLGALIEEQTIAVGFFNLVRWQSYQHVARQSLTFFNNEFSGRVVTKIWQAGTALGDLMIGVIQIVWFTGVYAITTIAVVGQLDWRLGIIVVLWVIVFALLARYFVPRMRANAAATAEAASSLNGRLVDSYANILTLKLFAHTEGNERYVRDGFDRFVAIVARLARNITGVRVSMAMLSGVIITAIAALSIHLWLTGAVTAGAVAFTLGLVLRLNMMLGRLMNQLNTLMRNFGIAQNSMEMISRPVTLTDRSDAVPARITQGEIRFENINFGYSPEKPVIQDFFLHIAAGEKVGLVGRSGAGKSTLISLLLRFYDLDEGAIRVDGQDIQTLTQDSLRQQIGVVTQDTSLLHRSVRENIKFGRPDASDAEMEEAARRAGAHEFITKLVDVSGRRGYDVRVGERGVKLSGGQRQRIALARVLLKNAPILILDEATSSLDAEVEEAIQSQLDNLMTGKTVIAIAHRLSTIARMDRLVVLDGGRILEQGTHHELVARGGLYAQLWARQSGNTIGQSGARPVSGTPVPAGRRGNVD